MRLRPVTLTPRSIATITAIAPSISGSESVYLPNDYGGGVYSHGGSRIGTPVPENPSPIACYCQLMPRQIGLLFAVLTVLICCSFAKEKYQQPGPIHLDREGEKWAEKTLHKLSTEEKVGQLFVVWVRAEFLNVNAPEYLQLRDSIHKYHLGGL